MHAHSRWLARSACAFLVLVPSCGSSGAATSAPFRGEVQKYLERYDLRLRTLTAEAREADWASATRIVPGDATNARRAQAANEALATFTGSTENIELARAYTKRKQELTNLQTRQLASILFRAGEVPQTAASIVRERIAAEIAQRETLYGFAYVLDGKRTTPAAIDAVLARETDLERRRRAWESASTAGPALRDGLVVLRALRNNVVRALGHRDYFSYRVGEYGLSTTDLAARVEEIERVLRPLYVELHTWVRYELAARHGVPPPDLIPAHWLPTHDGGDWSALARGDGFDPDATFAALEPLAVVQACERTYTGLGFEPLPPSFWERSSILPAPLDGPFAKSEHASSWHVDLDRDVRALLAVRPDAASFAVAERVLGESHYDLEQSNPKVPIVLRNGAGRAFHATFGELMGIAARQPRCLAALGLDPSAFESDPMRRLLAEALEEIAAVPFEAGTLFEWERAIYRDELKPVQWDARWWEIAARHQGIEPPSPHDEHACQPATILDVTETPAASYDRLIARVLAFQLHDHIARQILHADPHDTNYLAKPEVGDFLRSMMRVGDTVEWRSLLRDRIGQELSARPMADYFEPLRKWLVEQNKGRRVTLRGV